ncbi:MAG: hypothetical protein AB1689_02975 [Thermodesulfobacteriota bacterium]
MADDKVPPRARREVRLASELYDVALEGLAELLSLRQASNELGRQLWRDWDDRRDAGARRARPRGPFASSDVRDLAFDLAELNVKTFKEMTRIGRSYGDLLCKRIDAARRRSGDRHAADGGRQTLLSLRPRGDQYVGTFTVTNATGRTAEVVLPHALVFRKSSERDAWYVGVEQGRSRPRLAPDESRAIEIGISRASVQGREGRFLAETSVALTSGPSLQLCVELEVPHGAR